MSLKYIMQKSSYYIKKLYLESAGDLIKQFISFEKFSKLSLERSALLNLISIVVIFPAIFLIPIKFSSLKKKAFNLLHHQTQSHYPLFHYNVIFFHSLYLKYSFYSLFSTPNLILLPLTLSVSLIIYPKFPLIIMNS